MNGGTIWDEEGNSVPIKETPEQEKIPTRVTEGDEKYESILNMANEINDLRGKANVLMKKVAVLEKSLWAIFNTLPKEDQDRISRSQKSAVPMEKHIGFIPSEHKNANPKEKLSSPGFVATNKKEN